jgi:hypothetical protein
MAADGEGAQGGRVPPQGLDDMGPVSPEDARSANLIIPTPDGYCRCEEGRSLQGGTVLVSHFHHTCWQCGAEVLGSGRSTYNCHECGCGQSYSTVTTCGTFDPDFAANNGSPA